MHAPLRTSERDYCDKGASTEWELVYLSADIFQVKNTRSNNCLTINSNTQEPMETDTCDITNVRQQYRAQNGAAVTGDSWEMNSVWIPEGCISTTHHPRQRETLYIYSCDITRVWTTGQYIFY